ncbi:hypothetical protein MAR_018158 [Mya arenaria]|uniref:Uncharacterized protein n=1 Tax=Mya arenaria TaxID=6604 RepID=A0ABY7EGH1_MYAAR|nr:hypothetical protein MAR_018158 [Mya arenaria]
MAADSITVTARTSIYDGNCATQINKISGLRAQVVINLIKDPDVKNTVYQKISTQAPSLPTFSQQKTYMYIYSDMIIVKTKTEAHKKASGCKVEPREKPREK